MSEWYYEKEGTQQGPVSDTELRSLQSSGQVSGETLIWREGMDEWTPLSESDLDTPTAICAVTGERHPQAEMLQYGEQWILPDQKDAFVQRLNEGVPEVSLSWDEYHYADPGKRALAAKIALAIAMAAPILLIVGSFIYGAILATTNDGEVVYNEEAYSLFSTLGLLAVWGICFVFYGRWLHLASKNAHVLAQTSLDQTPGWSVGFYFVPIASLWKPFVSMKEIYNASLGESLDTGRALVGWWWGMHLTYSILNNFLPIIGIPGGIAALILNWLLISRITRAQQAAVERRF